MKQILYTLILLSISTFIIAQNSAYPQVPFTTIYEVEAEGNNIVSVGNCDKALYSHDGGNTWSYMNIDIDVIDIALVPGSDGKKVYIIDEDELYILNTADETITTTGVSNSSLISGEFEGMIVKNGTMVIVGSISVFQGSVSDLDFSKVGDLDYGGSDRINRVELTDNFAWVSTRHGLVFKGDLVNNTMTLAHDFGEDIRNFTMGTDNVGYASFSASAPPVKTIDGGDTWTPFNSFSEVSTLYAYGEDVIISRNTNRLVVSTDGGLTSTYVSYDANSDHSYLGDMKIYDDGTMYMAGESSTILKSTDYGLTHENLNPYPRAGITAININNTGRGIAVAGDGLILTTDDNGDNWSVINYESTITNNYISGCVSTNTGDLLIVNEEGILKVENGTTTKISDEILSSVMYNSNDDYYIGIKRQGGSELVRKSIDGGVTWESKTVLNDYGYTEAHNNNGIFFISVNDQEYVISKDHGETWETKTHSFGSGIFSASLYGDNIALLTAGNTIFKSSDGFETFSSVSTGYGQFNIQIHSENHYIFTSAQNSITTVKESTDGGITWKIADSYCSQTFCSDLQGDRYWMGQRGGHLNYSLLDLSTSTTDIKSSPLSIYNNVLQNGEAMTIVLDKNTNGTGVIFDQSGQKVDQFTLNGVKEKSISTNNLNSGIYFVKIMSGTDVSQGKFIIVN